MEIVLEFVLAIALSLILSFFLAKILSLSSSSSPNCEFDLGSGLKACKDFFQKVVTCERGSEGEKRGGGDLGESKQEKILLEGILDDSCGLCDDVKIDENENEVLKEVELPDIMDRVVGDFSGACVCSESENFAKFETYLTKDEVAAAKSEEIEVSESKCGYDIDEANKNEGDEDGCKCCIFDCNEIFVDKSNFFESEKTVKIGAESTKTELCMIRSEEMEVLKSNFDDEIDEANKIEEDFGESSIFNGKEISVDKRNFFESENIAKIESESTKTTEVGMARSEEIEVLESKCGNESGEGNENEEDDIEEVLFDEDDDWEGIERNELERLFGAAVAFVGNKCNANRISSIGSDVKMQLYGLHKIATVGPCHESQPMALKVSARANWNAWKQLGNMTPEIAMEQYVTILSRSIPGCIQDDIGVSADAEACGELASDIKAYQAGQLGVVDKRNMGELRHRVKGF